MANQLYGKSFERVRDRLKLHFVRTYWQYNRLQNMSGFRGSKIVSDSLVLVFMTPTKIRMNKPLHIGATILEHSKVNFFKIKITLFHSLYFFYFSFHRELCITNFMNLSSQILTMSSCQPLTLILSCFHAKYLKENQWQNF